MMFNITIEDVLYGEMEQGFHIKVDDMSRDEGFFYVPTEGMPERFPRIFPNLSTATAFAVQLRDNQYPTHTVRADCTIVPGGI